jgi:hypothetical protein
VDANGGVRGSRLGIASAIAQSAEPRGPIVETLGNDMNDALFAQSPGAAQQRGAERGAAKAFDGGPDDQIRDPGLVLARS